MAEKAKGKPSKKGDIPTDAAQVSATLTLSITAALAPTPSPPCYAFDHRFTFSLFSTTPITTLPLSTWAPSPTPFPPPSSPPSTQPDSSSSPPLLTFSSSIDLSIDRALLLTLQRSTLPLTIEHRSTYLPPPSDAPTTIPDDLPSPSKSKSKPSPNAPKRKIGGEEERRPGAGHPALEDLPFTPLSTFALPLSALLCPPYQVRAAAGEGTSFALPCGLSALSVTLHTGGVNPIHPSLLSSLLPLSIHLHSISPLTPHPPPSPFRDLSLTFSLPSPSPSPSSPSPSPSLPLPTTFLPSPSLTFTPTSLPPTVTFLGLLSPLTLHSLASYPRTGVRVEVRDRDDGRIPKPSEVQEDAERRRNAAEDAQREEEARLREEEKRKKQKPAPLKSPTGKGKKPEVPPEPVVGAAPAPAPASVEEVGPVYDQRSNVYGVAILPLHDLFGALSQVSGVAPVSAVYPPPEVPLLPPTTRSNPYTYTMLGYTVKLLHPLPSVEALRGGLRYGRVVAVMEEGLRGEGEGWSEVYEEVLRWNARACGVDDGLIEGHGSWEWLSSINAPPCIDDDSISTPAETEKADEKPKSREKGSATSRKQAGGVKDAKPELAPTEVQQAAPATRSVRADHLTGVSVTDGKQRWVVVEGLAVGRAGAAALAAVRDRLMEVKKRGAGRMRLLVDDSLAFPSRLYPETPLSLLYVRLQAPLSSLVTKASTLKGAGFLALSKLVMLSKGVVVKSLQQAWEGRVMLEGEEVKQLKEGWSKMERLDDVYGVELGNREREVRRASGEMKAAEERQTEEQLRISQLSNPTAAATPSVDPTLPTPPLTDDRAVSVPVAEAPAEMTAPVELEATVAAADAAVVRRRPKHPKSAPSAVPQLPSLTYSTPAEYRACLRALREACHADPHHHYTFHPEYLHSSIPRWESKEEADREERARERAKWLDARGFIVASGSRAKGGLFSEVGLLSEGERGREREERRRRKALEELVEEAWQARVERVQRAREVHFLTQPSFPSLFDRSPPTSIHLSGAEEVRARRAQEEREKREWQQRLVVDDPSFHVLWRGQHHVEGGRGGGGGGLGKSRLFALEGLRKGEPVKAALRFERDGEEGGGGGRSLVVQPAPVSITNEGPWVSLQERQIRDTGRVEGQPDFVRYITRHDLIYKRKVAPEKH